MKRFLTALTVAVLATAAPAFADTSASSPAILELIDRPTVTQSTYVVPKNQTLIEAGYSNGYVNTPFAGANGSAGVAYPQALIRIGTELKNLEVDVKAPSVTRSRIGGVVSGADDFQAGVKYLIRNAKRYAVSAQLGVDLPTGFSNNSSTGSTNGTQTSFALNGTYKITPMLEFKTTQKLTAQNFGGVRYGSYTPSFVLAAELPYASSIFAEYTLQTKYSGPSTPSRSSYLLGLSHAVSNRLALDIEASRAAAYSNGVASLQKSTGLGFGAAYQL